LLGLQKLKFTQQIPQLLNFVVIRAVRKGRQTDRQTDRRTWQN